MTEQTLLRLAMVLQNQAPTTLNKYICKIAEAVLLDYPDGISLYDLSNCMSKQFSLDFTEEEIKEAISKKGNNRIISSGTVLKLTASTQKKLAMQTSLSKELEDIIDTFIAAFSVEKQAQEISALLLKYFYHCFDSNVENLLSLLEMHTAVKANTFEASVDEIAVINDFIAWDNPQKNALIYRIVATCYEYCMLTIKKDALLTAELFKGKRFYLDANIIFRMAGINNEERKTVAQGFVNHCKRVRIELVCTAATLDEVFRVITSQVGYIKGIAGQSMPVSCDKLETINSHAEVNDFYRIYYNWCQKPENRCGDYTSFGAYLNQMVQETLSQLNIKPSSSFKVSTQATQYASQVDNLKNYKNTKRTWRHTSTASAETDITNIMDTLAARAGTGQSLWQTNDFLVSADQLLIAWSNDIYAGVPIVVLPSVWLSIILRFTGRTNDDYKSFCLFLTQRQHASDEDIINPLQLLKVINIKTSQVEIKERIITEITHNKSTYVFDTLESYVSNTERAFDKVLEEIYGSTEKRIKEVKEKMELEIEALKQSGVDSSTETTLQLAAEREKTIVTIAKKKAASNIEIYQRIRSLSWVIYVLSGVVILGGFVIWAFEIEPVYAWATSIIPGKVKLSIEWVWTIISAGIALISMGVGGWLSYMSSDSREKKLYKKHYNAINASLQGE